MTPYLAIDGATIYHSDCVPLLDGSTLALPEIQTVISDPPHMGMGYAMAVTLNLQPWDETNEGKWNAMLIGWYATWLPLVRLHVEASRGRAFFFTSPHHLPSLVRVAVVAGWTVQRLWFLPAGEALVQFGMPISEHAATGIERAFFDSPHSSHISDRVLDAILRGCSEGTVLDPFMGHGGTLRAARRKGCPTIGIEKDAENCRIAAQRFLVTV